MIRGNVKNNDITTVIGQISQAEPITAEIGRGDHSELLNRDLPNQHSIEAIFGLREIITELKQSNSELREYLSGETSYTLESIKNFNSILADIDKKLVNEISRAILADESNENKTLILERNLSEIQKTLSAKISEERQSISLLLDELETKYKTADKDLESEINTLQNRDDQMSDEIGILQNKLTLTIDDLNKKEEYLKSLNDALSTRVTVLHKAIEIETRKFEEKDSILLETINSETERAILAESDLQKTLQEEVARATAQESSLQTNFTSDLRRLETNVQNKLDAKADLKNGKLLEEQVPFLNVVCTLE